MKKRILCMLLAVALTLTAFGCNKSDDKQGGAASGNVDENGVTTDEITLSFWHYEDETTINLLAEKFMDMYPNIKVECRVIEDMSTDLTAAAESGEFPDVFEATDSDTALANMYWADITKYWDEDAENKNLMATINEYGIGCFDTDVRFAAP
ncbi:MAG: extracellular solute-binding protein, partial [Lachnospiraceae bacterium]|nr:extracellular solute-binding protein [Lachnospiraceae bacterium]